MTDKAHYHVPGSLQHVGGARATAALPLLVLLMSVLPQSAPAQALTVLYPFKGGADGAYPSAPSAGVIPNAAGNLYGTTANGGASNLGTVYKLDTTGHETVLHSFSGTDGANPPAGVILDAAGNLYGTTVNGGSSSLGTVYKLDNMGHTTVLHSFAGGADGANPHGDVILDAAGNLYGTTAIGGTYSKGTVYKLDTTGHEIVLHSFAGAFIGDGANPYSGVISDAAGNLYGTTVNGGTILNGTLYSLGTVYKLDTTGHLTLLHTFTSVFLDGSNPYGGVVRDVAGNLYGTTSGSAYNCSSRFPNRFFCGTVFKLDAVGNFSVLHRFDYFDGARPYAGLVRDGVGNLYGTTESGGAYPHYFGTLFKVGTTGGFSVLHSFTGGADGGFPGGLTQDAAGNLYGSVGYDGVFGFGAVFKLTP
jgi:uncharacterized repeat protein (TIGR03803 family)